MQEKGITLDSLRNFFLHLSIAFLFPVILYCWLEIMEHRLHVGIVPQVVVSFLVGGALIITGFLLRKDVLGGWLIFGGLCCLSIGYGFLFMRGIPIWVNFVLLLGVLALLVYIGYLMTKREA